MLKTVLSNNMEQVDVDLGFYSSKTSVFSLYHTVGREHGKYLTVDSREITFQHTVEVQMRKKSKFCPLPLADSMLTITSGPLSSLFLFILKYLKLSYLFY